MAGRQGGERREERREEGKLHQSNVGDRNALDISTALNFKAPTFLLPILGSWYFYYFECVFSPRRPSDRG